MGTLATLVVLLSALRFELYQGDQSAVYNLEGEFYYCRPLGSSRAAGYDAIEHTDSLLSCLQLMVDDYQLASYPQTPYDEADSSRDRLTIEAQYTDGRQLQVVQYLDDLSVSKAQALADAFHSFFADIQIALPNALEPKGLRIKGEYHEYIVDQKGKTLQRIDFTPDGIVRGGWRHDKPNATF